jgi:Domain of unknown function (DUF4440)
MFRITLSVVLLTLGAYSPRPAGQANRSAEQELRQVQDELTSAWARRDKSAIERLLAPEWSLITADGGTVTRADAIKYSIDSGQQTISQMNVDQVTVAIYGDAAVVRGRVVGNGTTLRGGPWTAKARFTDLCIRKSGHWLIVARSRAIATKLSALRIRSTDHGVGIICPSTVSKDDT